MPDEKPVDRAAGKSADDKPTGRAPVRRQSRGRARVGQAIGKAPHPDRAPTSVIRQNAPAAPVFVDPSGARRRRLRLVTVMLGFALIAALVAIWVSQLSGPAGPPDRAPCPTTSASCSP